MTPADISSLVQLGVLAGSAVTIGAAMLKRYAVANHNDRLERIADFAAGAGADIHEALSKLPADADADAVRKALVSKAVAEATGKYGDSVAAIGIAPDVLATQIDREVSKLLAHAPPKPVPLITTQVAA